MSNHTNHRREERRRTETGPRWENPNPGKGSNSTHVARSRSAWKRINARRERRANRTLASPWGAPRAPREEEA